MGVAAVVYQLEAGRRRAWSEDLCGRLDEGARLGVAVRGLLDGLTVDPERDVVEEETAVHLGYVDAPLDAVGKGGERTDEIVAIDPDVECEVVAGAGWNADEGEIVCNGGRGDHGE
jgi:hypothetical protein